MQGEARQRHAQRARIAGGHVRRRIQGDIGKAAGQQSLRDRRAQQRGLGRIGRQQQTVRDGPAADLKAQPLPRAGRQMAQRQLQHPRPGEGYGQGKPRRFPAHRPAPTGRLRRVPAFAEALRPGIAAQCLRRQRIGLRLLLHDLAEQHVPAGGGAPSEIRRIEEGGRLDARQDAAAPAFPRPGIARQRHCDIGVSCRIACHQLVKPAQP